MSAPLNGTQPTVVSEEQLNQLEHELLAVFTRARPGSGAYSGSSHVTHPSTSSLPDQQSSSRDHLHLVYFLLTVILRYS